MFGFSVDLPQVRLKLCGKMPRVIKDCILIHTQKGIMITQTALPLTFPIFQLLNFVTYVCIYVCMHIIFSHRPHTKE